MCLAATEVSGSFEHIFKHHKLTVYAKVVFPTTKFSWSKHVTAVGNFIEQLGPGAFTTGILHKLFVGLRPLLVSLPNYRTVMHVQ